MFGKKGAWKVSWRCLNVWRVSGRSLEGVWKVPERCSEGLWKVSRRCPESVWKVFWGYLEGVGKVSWRSLNGVWKVSGKFLNVSGSCMEGVWNMELQTSEFNSVKLNLVGVTYRNRYRNWNAPYNLTEINLKPKCSLEFSQNWYGNQNAR